MPGKDVVEFAENRPQGRPKKVVHVAGVEVNPRLFSEKAPLFDQGVELTYDQEKRLLAFTDDHRRQLFLHAFARTGTVAGAARLIRDPGTGRPIISVDQHKMWMERDPEYAELFEEIEAAVDARWEDILLDKAVHGVEERWYDAEGKLERRRVREDSSLLSQVVGARLPKYRRDRDAGTQIAIVINQVAE